jgi:uncharacterized protein (DUF302 family)
MVNILNSKQGIEQLASEFSFTDTVRRLEATITSEELKIFAHIDFSEAAANEGLKMNPTQLFIFGNPKAGTPLIIAAPTIALDLPLKILVSQDEQGKVWVSYNALDYLKERHNVPQKLLENLSGIKLLAESTAIQNL